MKRWKKGLAVTAILAALILGLMVPAFGSTANVYLMAVNERVLDTTVENMPRTVGGVLYVPYTMLSNQVNGINLGVSALYSTTRRTVLVTDGQRGVVFDIQNNSAVDLNDSPVTARAMVRNSMVFLPIDWLCQYFGTISCTRTRTPYGTLIRITNSAAILSDRDFADAAGLQLADNLRRYLEAGGGSTGNDPLPSEEVGTSDPPSGAELFLALRSGAAAADCAQLLESQDQRALFLFTCEDLLQDGDSVRRIVAAGHTVGLALNEEDLKDCLAEAAYGRKLLAAAARYNALVVSAPNLNGEERKGLEEEGFVVWSTTVWGRESASGASLVRGLNNRRINYVEIECSTEGLSLLRGALTAMDEENCQIYQATAPALG